MTKLINLDPRLAGWAEAEAAGRSCECCGATVQSVYIARFPPGFLCEECADAAGYDSEG